MYVCDGSCEKQGLSVSLAAASQRNGRGMAHFVCFFIQLPPNFHKLPNHSKLPSAHDTNMQLSPLMTAMCSSAHNTDMQVAQPTIPACDLANDSTCKT